MDGRLSVVSVHIGAKWAEIQARYVREFLPDAHYIGVMAGDYPEEIRGLFDEVVDHPRYLIEKQGLWQSKDHALHLDKVTKGLSGRVLFLDSDAFPIRPVPEEQFTAYPIVAVCRTENVGDRHPHPSFCWVRSIEDWKERALTWAPGLTGSTTYPWRKDTGGKLLHQLIGQGVPWRPLTRTNKVNPHPIAFGIYGDLVYHHSSGTRHTRYFLFKQLYGQKGMEEREVPDGIQNDEMYEQIRRDPAFWKQFEREDSP